MKYTLEWFAAVIKTHDDHDEDASEPEKGILRAFRLAKLLFAAFTMSFATSVWCVCVCV